MSKVNTGTDELLCEVDDGVALVTFNRPDKRNALSETLTPALRAVLPELDRRRDVRCVMLTGAGPAFCAGGDVSQMGGNRLVTGDERSLEEKVAELEQRQRTLTLRLFQMKTPTIAALPGAAAGAGMSIALACDLRIAAASAFVTAAFGRIGLSGDYGGSWLLSRLVGTAVAKDMYFTSRRVGAEEGLKLGLFNRVAGDDEFREASASYAREVAQAAPIAIRYMKAHINLAPEIDLGACLGMEAEHLMRCAETSDHREAVAAFMEKRSPVFNGE
ncbi:MAG: enoyl-CoA hydratase-related protein [Gammaproteobacteria bacterium]